MAKNAHIQCPVCNSVMKSPQGLHGHLRFKHDIWDDELDRVFEQAQKNHVAAESEVEEDDEPTPQGDSSPTQPPQAPSLERESLETMLSRLERLRKELKKHDRSKAWGDWVIFRRDEGAKEALEASDEIEMVIRERLGTGEADDNLRRKAVNSLDAMENLVECRRQREAIEKKFDGERAEQRIQKLDRREASIRSHVRQEWDVGTPAEDLPESDPVTSQ